MPRNQESTQFVQLRKSSKPRELQIKHPDTYGAEQLMYKVASKYTLVDGKYILKKYVQVIPALPVDFPRLEKEGFSLERPNL